MGAQGLLYSYTGSDISELFELGFHLSILASGLREVWELSEPNLDVCVKECRTLDSLEFAQ